MTDLLKLSLHDGGPRLKLYFGWARRKWPCFLQRRRSWGLKENLNTSSTLTRDILYFIASQCLWRSEKITHQTTSLSNRVMLLNASLLAELTGMVLWSLMSRLLITGVNYSWHCCCTAAISCKSNKTLSSGFTQARLAPIELYHTENKSACSSYFAHDTTNTYTLRFKMCFPPFWRSELNDTQGCSQSGPPESQQYIRRGDFVLGINSDFLAFNNFRRPSLKILQQNNWFQSQFKVIL